MSARESVHLGEQQLDDYADGVLSDAERAIAERHLAACNACRRAVEETRAVLAWATEERAAVRAPAELWPLVASRTIHLAEVRRAVLRSMRGLLLVGAIVLVAATALITWKVARWSAGRDVAPSVERPVSAGAGGHVVPPTPPVPPEPPEPPRPSRP